MPAASRLVVGMWLPHSLQITSSFVMSELQSMQRFINGSRGVTSATPA
jgi:hypothetical protein